MRKSLVFLLSAILLFIASAVTFAADMKVFGRVHFRYDHSLSVRSADSAGTYSGGAFYGGGIRIGAKGNLAEGISYLTLFTAGASKGTKGSTTMKLGVVYGWIGLKFGPIGIHGGIINDTFARSMTSSSAQLFGDYTQVGRALGFTNIKVGLKIFGSLLNNRFHFGFVFANSPSTSFANANPGKIQDQFDLDGLDNYMIALRLQLDPFGKWKEGKEWLQTSDMKMTLGVGAAFVPRMGSDTVTADDGDGALKITADLGFTISLIYVSVDFFVNMTNLGKKDGPGGTDTPSQTNMGLKADLAVSLVDMIPGLDLVPVLRFEWINHEAIVSKDYMRLSAAINMYPGNLGNKFRITPEVGFDLDREGKNSKKESFVRVNFMLNF